MATEEEEMRRLGDLEYLYPYRGCGLRLSLAHYQPWSWVRKDQNCEMYYTTKHQAKEPLVTLSAKGLGQMYWNLTPGLEPRKDMSPIHLETP